MSGAHVSLDAAATDRKARLAKLASLKRKGPDSDDTDSGPQKGTQPAQELSASDVYISGRNYDIGTKGPKLGFEAAPLLNQDTIEEHAERLRKVVADQATIDEADAEKGIDLFKLQPKKPNWDLKRDLAERMRSMDVRTQNAIARLVRERIEKQKREALENNGRVDVDDVEKLGLQGGALAEAVSLREQEEAEEERRERERSVEDATL